MTAFRASLRVAGLAAGLLVWSTGFIALYALHAVGCAAGWMDVSVGPLSALRLVLVAVWLLHLALLAWLYLWFRRWTADAPESTGDHFIAVASIALTVTALVATVYGGLPVVLLRQCV